MLGPYFDPKDSGLLLIGLHHCLWIYTIFTIKDCLFQYSALSAAVYLGPLVILDNVHYLQKF